MPTLVDTIIKDAIRDARKRLKYAESKGYTEMAEQAKRLIAELQAKGVRFQLERANARCKQGVTKRGE